MTTDPTPDPTEDKVTKKFQKELNAGLVSLILLALLDRARQPQYGYQIAKDLEARTGELPMMKQGALYPVLRSMAASGLLSSQVEPSVSGPPRRYYEITDQGRETLRSWVRLWRRAEDIVNTVLEDAPDA